MAFFSILSFIQILFILQDSAPILYEAFTDDSSAY